MNAKKFLSATALAATTGIAAASCGGGEVIIFDEEVDASDAGPVDSSLLDSSIDGETSTDATIDASKDATPGADADSGPDCNQITVTFTGPSAKNIEQGALGVKLFCFQIAAACKSQVLAALQLQNFGSAGGKDYTTNYALRNSVDMPIGGYKNADLTGKITFTGMTEAIAASTKDDICAYADISISAPVGSSIGLKITPANLTFSDPAAKVSPAADIIGNLHLIIKKP